MNARAGAGRTGGAGRTRGAARAAVDHPRSRTLPPLPPRPGRGGGAFAESWWGGAWVRALEESALDPGRLSRGRTYARAGHVAAITVTPGRITAAVHGSRPRPYRTGIRLRELSDQEWDAFLGAVAAQPAHIAALLDNDMPRTLAEAAETAGVRLLPAQGELVPHCSCPDHGEPCKHAAALCYQAARFLDADPFVLLLLRGRGETELLDELRRRNTLLAAARSGSMPGEPGPDGDRQEGARSDPLGRLPGISARDALATTVRPPLPAPLPLPVAPGGPPLLPEASGAPTGGAPDREAPDKDIPDPDALDFLATDTAARAHACLLGLTAASATTASAATTAATAGSAPDAFPQLTAWHDAVRLAATHPHLTGRRTFSPLFAHLAERTGSTTTRLARAAAAWRQGGEAGLAVLEEEWDPPAGDFDRARGALAAAEFPRMSISRNRLTAAGVQLRFGRDGRWYPYRGDPGSDDWWPEGRSAADPVDALSDLHRSALRP
ncbi:SWIM zinc finger family protein [Streptomyces sp. N2-109]|uniref:SWIM zinc finger family protein n=1 Tax=Streptomyces gossypii TaxID=2883101 RepID=A0ABT2K2N5_9ACTN|nr:SWIM zinc finger family protein [Streptomyces gossypii]MCT2594425.1 SWIM zinc finger family protein [Streptomyces gossypii]